MKYEAEANALEAFFQAAVLLPPERRLAFLDSACGRDELLRRRLARMLELDASSDKILDRPAELTAGSDRRIGQTSGAGSASPFRDEPPGPLAGRTLGAYQIVRPLGRGGMGTVYEARQQRPARTVALKVMDPGLGHGSALRRFEYEAEILARLQHPGIAQVYEAGVAREGLAHIPYFAMELVPEAVPLTTFANRRQLVLQERLELFLRVCAAVHHGHLSGVIHRDLKPANILVSDRATPEAGGSSVVRTARSGSRARPATQLADDLQPKVIDFGIARLHERDDGLHATRTGDIVGTPAYMSPEQARGDGSAVDARADVYALGVVLFELITGERPFAESGGVHACLERILHDEPRRPSTVARSLDDELDCIVLKALRKDPNERYQSVDQLATDLRRFLNHEPVEAKRGSTWYMLRKSIRRHQGAVAAVGGLIVVLAAGLGVSLSLWGQTQSALTAAEAARKTAEAETARATQASAKQKVEAEKANQTFEFLRDVLIQEELLKRQEHDRQVLERILVDAGRRVQNQDGLEPDVRARIMLFIFQAYQAFDNHEEALAWGRRYLEQRRHVVPDEDESSFIFSLVQDNLALRSGAVAGSDEVFRRRWRDAEQRFGVEAVPTLMSRVCLGGALLLVGCQYGEARAVIEDLPDDCGRVLGNNHFLTRGALQFLMHYRIAEGRYAEAVAIAEDNLARLREAEPENVTSELSYLGQLAEAHLQAGDLAEAEALYRDVWVRCRAGFGDDVPFVLSNAFGLGEALLELGRFDEAEPLLADVAAQRAEVLGPVSPETATALTLLGELRYRQHDLDAARAHLAEARRVLLLQFGECHPSLVDATISLAKVAAATGETGEARRLLLGSREALSAEDEPTLVLRARVDAALAQLGADGAPGGRP